MEDIDDILNSGNNDQFQNNDVFTQHAHQAKAEGAPPPVQPNLQVGTPFDEVQTDYPEDPQNNQPQMTPQVAPVLNETKNELVAPLDQQNIPKPVENKAQKTVQEVAPSSSNPFAENNPGQKVELSSEATNVVTKQDQNKPQDGYVHNNAGFLQPNIADTLKMGNLQNKKYPPPSQAAPPPGQGALPQGQGALPPGQGALPQGQGVLTPGQGAPPQGVQPPHSAQSPHGVQSQHGAQPPYGSQLHQGAPTMPLQHGTQPPHGAPPPYGTPAPFGAPPPFGVPPTHGALPGLGKPNNNNFLPNMHPGQFHPNNNQFMPPQMSSQPMPSPYGQPQAPGFRPPTQTPPPQSYGPPGYAPNSHMGYRQPTPVYGNVPFGYTQGTSYNGNYKQLASDLFNKYSDGAYISRLNFDHFVSEFLMVTGLGMTTSGRTERMWRKAPSVRSGKGINLMDIKVTTERIMAGVL